MRDATVYFDLADTSDPAFDRPVEILLIGLLAISPLALGAVQAWSETLFIALAFAIAATLALKLLFRPDVQFVRSWTFWPIAIFLALVTLQLIPLPAELVKLISPNTFAKKQELLGDLPGAAERHVAHANLHCDDAARGSGCIGAASGYSPKRTTTSLASYVGPNVPVGT